MLTKYLDVASPIFSTPDLTIFCRLDSLDLFCIGQHITATNAVLERRPNSPDDWCRQCGGYREVRYSVLRGLA
ncbi:MAG: ISL3 family transposase, partial [Brevibacterium aurantiacum]